MLDQSFDLKELSQWAGRGPPLRSHQQQDLSPRRLTQRNRRWASDPWKDASDTEAVVNAYFWRVCFYRRFSLRESTGFDRELSPER